MTTCARMPSSPPRHALLAPPGDEGDAVLARLGAALGGLGDLERGLTRALHRTASPAELVATLRALASVGPALGLQARPQKKLKVTVLVLTRPRRAAGLRSCRARLDPVLRAPRRLRGRKHPCLHVQG